MSVVMAPQAISKLADSRVMSDKRLWLRNPKSK